MFGKLLHFSIANQIAKFRKFMRFGIAKQIASLKAKNILRKPLHVIIAKQVA